MLSLPFKAGFFYFLILFAVGFLLGTVRVFLIAPLLQEALATALELPVILTVSWIVCARLVRHFYVPAILRTRITMGAVALALLLTAECMLGVVGFGLSMNDQLARYQQTGPMLGLMAQILFALFPAVQLYTKK
ncbi:MAG: hypothetical protein K2Q01_02730 [Rickettsiales bacterium]|nr:hypothetical protein [Rickettsiales bacterium]